MPTKPCDAASIASSCAPVPSVNSSSVASGLVAEFGRTITAVSVVPPASLIAAPSSIL